MRLLISMCVCRRTLQHINRRMLLLLLLLILLLVLQQHGARHSPACFSARQAAASSCWSPGRRRS
jgi:hypothetical protein